MSSQRLQDIDNLNRLYSLYEKRALQELNEKREKLENVLHRLNEQQQLVNGLRAELDQSHQMRSTGRIQKMTASLLIAECAYRESITRELDKEKFYLTGFESDVSDAQVDMAKAHRDWLKSRERIKALEEQTKEFLHKASRIKFRREEANQDDMQLARMNNYG